MRTTLIAALLTTISWSQNPSENPQLASTKAFYVIVRTNVLKSADKMPEDKYGFRPTDEVRTYGQMLAHIADAQFFLCGTAKEGVSSNRGIEKSATTKAAIVKGLMDGFAYCDAVYAELTDASSAAMVPFFNQQRTKLSLLAFNTAHTFEHYGNLVTYMRMNKIVPPSSEPPPAAPPAKPAR